MPRRKFNLDYPRLGAFAWIRADRPGKAKRNKGRLRRQRCRVLSIKGFASPPKQQARCDATATRHCRNCRRRILRLRQNRLLLLARPRAPSAGDNDVRGVRHRSRHGADIDSIDIMYLPHNTNRTRRPSPSGYIAASASPARPSRSRRLAGDDLQLRGPTEPLLNDKILPNKFDDLLIYLSGLQVSSMILVQSLLPTHFFFPLSAGRRSFRSASSEKGF